MRLCTAVKKRGPGASPVESASTISVEVEKDSVDKFMVESVAEEVVMPGTEALTPHTLCSMHDL